MALSTVIFDYGMVLSGPADPASHHELVKIFGASPEDFEREYWLYRHAYDAGEYDGPGYWRRCAEDVGLTLSEEQIEQLIAHDINMWGSLNQTMVEWAISISKSGFKTGILSNIGFELAAPLSKLDWAQGFTHNTWSCDLRLAKPDPAIYHHVIDALKIRPEEALFLDDRQENILSAEAVGLQGIIFHSVEQLREELQSRGFAEILPPLTTSDKIHTAMAG
jgi:putative hydrolase of the HAD superfamily